MLSAFLGAANANAAGTDEESPVLAGVSLATASDPRFHASSKVVESTLRERIWSHFSG